jgi:NADPH2:quinone reductase
VKALIAPRLGGPDVLEVADLPDPSAPGAGEVVVAVSHVGLNFHDTLVVSGSHVVRPEPPFSPGSEYAGTVVAVGSGVSSPAVGDRVAGNEEYGCAREFVTARADRVTVIPADVSSLDAATVLVTYATAFHALVQRAGVRPGETVVVLGAAGGVGSAAVDVADLLGARVLAGASTAERARSAAGRGASAVFDYSGDAKQRIKDLTDGHGADVVFDPVGGALTGSAVRALGWGGRLLVVGFASGEIPTVKLNLPLVKGASLVGVFFGEFVRRDRRRHEQNLTTIFRWSSAGKLRPHVHDVRPLEEGAGAYAALAGGAATGKIVLTVGQ